MISIRPTGSEIAAGLPGDDLVPDADVVMDRAFTLAGSPEQVWPWIVQLGKDRAGWYLPWVVERWLPTGKRAIRTLDPRWQALAVGEVIPDWGGRDATFEVVTLSAPTTLVYRSRRGQLQLSWTIVLQAAGQHTRAQFRLRLAPVRRRRLARYGGGFLDWLTILGLAAGLRERRPRPVQS